MPDVVEDYFDRRHSELEALLCEVVNHLVSAECEALISPHEVAEALLHRGVWPRAAPRLPSSVPHSPVPLASSARSPNIPTTVLLHGLDSSKATWTAVTRQLSDAGYPALALDFRGHGDTPMGATTARPCFELLPAAMRA